MTITDPIERVVLTHLQIPLKEPFRISGGEVAIKDAILVVLETSSAVGHGESSPMAASFGYPGDTPESCWDSLTNTIAPSLLGQTVQSIEDIGAVASSWKSGQFAARAPRRPSGTCSGRRVTRRSPSSWAPPICESTSGSNRASRSGSTRASSS